MSLPDKMKEEVGYLIKGVSDHRHEELTPDMIYQYLPGITSISKMYLMCRIAISSRKTALPQV